MFIKAPLNNKSFKGRINIYSFTVVFMMVKYAVNVSDEMQKKKEKREIIVCGHRDPWYKFLPSETEPLVRLQARLNSIKGWMSSNFILLNSDKLRSQSIGVVTVSSHSSR